MKDVIYLHRNRVKAKILYSLHKPKTPTQISKELKIHRPSVSRILLEIQEKGFVKCINPEDASGRFYALTEKGKKVLGDYKRFLEK